MLHLLPIEILRIIAENTTPTEGEGEEEEEYKHENRTRFVCERASIAPLSMTCHHLRNATAPMLFEKIVFKSLHVFYKTLKDVERVKSTLAAYPNVAGYVRHLHLNVDTWGAGKEIDHGMANFASYVLESLPSLHILELAASGLTIFDNLLLHSVVTHKTLRQVIIQELDTKLETLPTQILSPSVNGKMVIEIASFHGNGKEHDQLAKWERVLALGVHVNTLLVIGLYDGGSNGWSEISFTGLEILDTQQAFPSESLGEDFPGSFTDFVKQHPYLTRIEFTSLGEEVLAGTKPTWLSSPLIGPFFRAFDGSSWILRRVLFVRTDENQGYQCEEVYLSLAEDMEAEDILSALCQSCAKLETLYVEIRRDDVDPRTFIDFASYTVRHMFNGGSQLRDGFSFIICLQWTIEAIWDELTGITKEGFSEDLTTPMKNLTLEIANLFPNAVHVHHLIGFGSELLSFFFTISRSSEGLVSVVTTDRKSFAKHPHIDSQTW